MNGFVQRDPVTSEGQRVNGNGEALVFAIAETENQDAIRKGNGYNLNTGEISISADSAIMYVKNDQDETLVVSDIIIGIGSASVTDIPIMTLVRNPTAGTIVSGATSVDMNENRNFGSSKTLKTTTLTYKGASGNTFTDGSDIAIVYVKENQRTTIPIDWDLEKGSTLGIKINPRLSSGSVNCYVALVLFERDEKNDV